jgi:NAD dependent epimerase/dehydratase family enzyme
MLIFGEMGSELLLSGQFVHPKVLLEHGFRFGYAAIDEALSFAFGKMK